MGLTRLAITRPLAMLMFIFALIIMGIVSYRQLRVDRLPNISFPFVSVQLSWPGASPEDIEEFLVKPVEGAVSGIPGVATISSNASSGNGSVSVQLAEGADANQAAIDIERRVSAIRNRLPTDAGQPTVNKADPNSFPVMNIALSSQRRQLDELFDIASNVVQPKLQSVLGVADANLVGGLQKEIQVQVDLSKLSAVNISLQQVVNAINRENVNSPAGQVVEGRTNVNIRTVGLYQSVEDIRNINISQGVGGAPVGASQGGGVQVRHVANVVEGYKNITRIQRVNGAPAIGLSITKQSDANSLKVAEDVKAALERVKAQIPEDVDLIITNDSSRFTRDSLDAVQYDLGLAVILTALVLLVFLHSWRNVIIVTLAIPTSLISTMIFMYFLGLSLNTITLMALALAIGILVDDSIVVIENIHRHLKMGEGPMIAALNGRSEIGMAAIAITMVDVVVYMPIAFMGGNIGRLFREYGIVIAIATLFSLFVSFTLTPMLASRWLAAHKSGHKPGPSEWFGIAFDRVWNKFAAGYAKVLRLSLRARPLVLLIAIAALAGSVALVPLGKLKTEYSPTDDDNQFNVSVQMPTGTSLAATDQAVKAAEEILAQVPEVDRLFVSIGAGGFGGGGTSGSIAVQLVDKKHRTRSVFEITQDVRNKGRALAAQGANLSVSIQNPLGGGGGGMQIRLLGEDYTRLQQISRQVDQVIRTVDGVVDVRAAQLAGGPEIRAVANRNRMADLGLSQQTIATTLRTAIAGSGAGSLQPDGQLKRDITVIARQEDREDIQRLGNLPIPVANGYTRLSQVADIARTTSPASISRQDRARVLSISANVAGRPLGDVATDVRETLKSIQLPDGYQIIVGGSVQSLDTAFATLMGALTLSILLIYMLMVALYESWLYPMIIMFALPLAIIGAFVALVISENTLNLYSMIGIIMLMGLVAKNGILLVDYTNTLRARGVSRKDALIEAGPVRLKPIIMTSTTICMAMLPLALKLEAGAESRAPLAVVVIGGVISSTLLTLFVVPTMYTYIDSFGAFMSRIFRGGKPALEPAIATVAESIAANAQSAAIEEAATPETAAQPANGKSRRWSLRK